LRYFVELSYNGSAYHGWQIQPNAITVQEVLEAALSTILKSTVSIVGAGRTDTGVHAKQMFAHFDFEGDIAKDDLVYKLNSFLPKDIVIHEIIKVKHDAHARFDATSRTYNYRISTSKDAFNFKFAYGVFLPLNLEAMDDACKILLMYSDFQCFSKTHTDVKTYYCNIKAAQLRKEDGEIIFTITADRFLRNMVRAIVGTLLNIGLGKMDADELHRIIKSKDRSEAGFSAPAHGLYLTEVKYPEEIFLND
jgi:tRNA pseudouridine38-40 synthase